MWLGVTVPMWSSPWISPAVSPGSLPKGRWILYCRPSISYYAKIAAYQIRNADIVIQPKVGYIGFSDLSKRHEAILEGEKAAVEALPAIQEIVEKLKQEGRL